MSAQAQDVPRSLDVSSAHEFYFTRGIYGASDDEDADWGPRWAVDGQMLPEAFHLDLLLQRSIGEADTSSPIWVSRAASTRSPPEGI